ncbi:MAG: hypothetical protein ACNA8W_14040, partial [Bradymonadaceae bacterium]
SEPRPPKGIGIAFQVSCVYDNTQQKEEVMSPKPKEKDEKVDEKKKPRVGSANEKKVDPEFQRLAEENLERYRAAMEELAK